MSYWALVLVTDYRPIHVIAEQRTEHWDGVLSSLQEEIEEMQETAAAQEQVLWVLGLGLQC